MTALRILQRMKRDWIMTGRRPVGLCGAAILMSTKLHGLNFQIQDIQNALRVSESTIKKRIDEFQNSPAASLTLKEFQTINLEELSFELDPPSFTRLRDIDEPKPLAITNYSYEDDENLEDLTDDEEIKQCILTDQEEQIKTLL